MNMITRLFLMAALVTGSAFTPKPDPAAEVRAALDGQVNAWNAADLDKAMAYYWNSPDLLWINKTGISKGYQPVLEDYQKFYTDKTKMGNYSYEALYIETLSPRTVLYTFKWQITLNGKKQLGGVSSQLWKKIEGRWVITAEHAS